MIIPVGWQPQGGPRAPRGRGRITQAQIGVRQPGSEERGGPLLLLAVRTAPRRYKSAAPIAHLCSHRMATTDWPTTRPPHRRYSAPIPHTDRYGAPLDGTGRPFLTTRTAGISCGLPLGRHQVIPCSSRSVSSSQQPVHCLRVRNTHRTG